MAISQALKDKWRDWALTNLHRGVRPETLAAEMTRNRLSEDELRYALGEAFGAKSEPPDHEKIANCAITRRPGITKGVRKVLTRKAQLYTWEGFLTDEACDRTIELLNGQLRPSTVTDNRGDSRVRTSSTCDLGEVDDPFVFELQRLIADGLGIHYAYSETTQGQKYEIGQEFKSHTDYFEPGTLEFLPNTGELGQRTWTFMVYLNTTPEGGATRFPRLDKIFRPKKGMAVIWNNLNPDGSVNPWTLHHGMKPRAGNKYIITKWFREKGWGPMFREE